MTTSELRSDFVSIIVSELQRQRITRKELARRMGVTPPNITHMLNDQRNITINNIEKIGQILGIRIRMVVLADSLEKKKKSAKKA